MRAWVVSVVPFVCLTLLSCSAAELPVADREAAQEIVKAVKDGLVGRDSAAAALLSLALSDRSKAGLWEEWAIAAKDPLIQELFPKNLRRRVILMGWYANDTDKEAQKVRIRFFPQGYYRLFIFSKRRGKWEERGRGTFAFGTDGRVILTGVMFPFTGTSSVEWKYVAEIQDQGMKVHGSIETGDLDPIPYTLSRTQQKGGCRPSVSDK